MPVIFLAPTKRSKTNPKSLESNQNTRHLSCTEKAIQPKVSPMWVRGASQHVSPEATRLFEHVQPCAKVLVLVLSAGPTGAGTLRWPEHGANSDRLRLSPQAAWKALSQMGLDLCAARGQLRPTQTKPSGSLEGLSQAGLDPCGAW